MRSRCRAASPVPAGQRGGALVSGAPRAPRRRRFAVIVIDRSSSMDGLLPAWYEDLGVGAGPGPRGLGRASQAIGRHRDRCSPPPQGPGAGGGPGRRCGSARGARSDCASRAGRRPRCAPSRDGAARRGWGTRVGAPAATARPGKPSSRGESHPPALTDPYVTVSRHTALVVLVTRPGGRR